MRYPTVELHIGELVVDGAVGDQAGLAEALERELTRLFAEGGLPPSLGSSGTLASWDGGSCMASPGPIPEEIGARIAGAIYGALR
jgi:hypothetical protein